MGDLPRRDFELGDWLVQPSLNTICRQTTTVHLRPKLMELLELLAQYEGRVAGKEVIFRKVWHGECVVESVLGRSIADLRRLLGDDAVTPRYILTVPRRGYRLVAPVCWKESETGAGAGPSIAVLPFADLAPAGDQQYLCDGVAEELTNSLCGVPGLSVIARTSAFSFRDKAVDVREIGRQLGVGTLLEGAIQRCDDRLRVTVQLVETDKGQHLWSQRFDRPASDVFALEDEIAEEVVAALRSALLPDAGSRQSVRQKFGHHSKDAKAQHMYLRGRYLSARRTPSTLAEAAVCFEQALERDPAYGPAHASLADCLGVRSFLGYPPAKEGLSKAMANARRAVELDPTLAEGHAILATCLTFTAWKWDEAERSFVRAIELNPNYSLARMWYSHLLAIEGRTREALEQARRAVRLDPLSLNARASVALRLSEMGRFEPAIKRLAADLAADPEYPLTHFHLGRLYCAVGRYEEAIVHLQRATAGFPLASGFLGLVLARVGRMEEARVVLGELERMAAKREIGAVPFALVHWGLGSNDSAMRWLSEAFDAKEPVLPLLVRDPAVASLGSIPGFAGLVGRLQLPGGAARSHEGPR